MKKVIFLLFISMLIGMGLGILGSQMQHYKKETLRKKRIVGQEEIIKEKVEEIKQMQNKLNEQQAKIKRLQTKLSEQQEEMIQLQTGINETQDKQTAQKEDLEEVLEALGDKRVFFP